MFYQIGHPPHQDCVFIFAIDIVKLQEQYFTFWLYFLKGHHQAIDGKIGVMWELLRLERKKMRKKIKIENRREKEKRKKRKEKWKKKVEKKVDKGKRQNEIKKKKKKSKRTFFFLIHCLANKRKKEKKEREKIT